MDKLPHAPPIVLGPPLCEILKSQRPSTFLLDQGTEKSTFQNLCLQSAAHILKSQRPSTFLLDQGTKESTFQNLCLESAAHILKSQRPSAFY